jgi:hypothetical protein
VDAAKGVKGITFPIMKPPVSLVLELPIGPRMARSILFCANPIFRSANILVFLTGVTLLSFSKVILTINDFLDILGDFLGDFSGDFFFFLPKGNLTMSFSAYLLGDFFLGRRIRSGGTF